MQASALPKPERVNQVWLDEAMDVHASYLQAVPGGQRLFLSFKDACHLDFSGRNLAGAEMVAAELAHAIFKGACLARSNLFGANLEAADLRECDLARADLRGVSLSGANLSGADLHEADTRGQIAQMGRCKRHAPRPLTPDRLTGDAEPRWDTFWPRVASDDWCGEWDPNID